MLAFKLLTILSRLTPAFLTYYLCQITVIEKQKEEKHNLLINSYLYFFIRFEK